MNFQFYENSFNVRAIFCRKICWITILSTLLARGTGWPIAPQAFCKSLHVLFTHKRNGDRQASCSIGHDAKKKSPWMDVSELVCILSCFGLTSSCFLFSSDDEKYFVSIQTGSEVSGWKSETFTLKLCSAVAFFDKWSSHQKVKVEREMTKLILSTTCLYSCHGKRHN